MNILIEKYKDFPFNEEFSSLTDLLLYESGGDFKTYAKIIGYSNYESFQTDFEEYHNLFHNRYFRLPFHLYRIIHNKSHLFFKEKIIEKFPKIDHFGQFGTWFYEFDAKFWRTYLKDTLQRYKDLDCSILKYEIKLVEQLNIE